jgi:hypothetical protein
MFYFGDVFESVFDTGDVFGNSIFTREVFESCLQSDVNKHLVCNLAMLMNCNYF